MKYFGYILTPNGIKEKIADIHDMPLLTNKAELETVLGMVTYISKFASNISKVMIPMCQMFGNDTLLYGKKHTLMLL